MPEDGDDEEEQVIVVPKMDHKKWDVYAGKLRELKKRQDVVITALSVPAFFALAKCNCPSGFVAAFDEEQQGFASSCDAWFVFGVAGLAMVPCTGTGAAAKAAHALECVNVFGNFVNELSPRSPRFDEFASGSGLSSWKGGGDAGVGRAATLLDSAAEAHERAKGKRPAGVNASTINNPKTRAAAQEAMDDPYSGVAGPERGTCPYSLLRARSSYPAAALDRRANLAAWIGSWPVLAALLWIWGTDRVGGSAGYKGNCTRAKGRVPIPRQFQPDTEEFPVSALRAGFQSRASFSRIQRSFLYPR
jgi:hypothetical protein